MEKVAFRKADKADSQEISLLLRSLSETYITTDFPAAGATKLLDSMQPESIAKYIDSDFIYIVAVSNGKIIGVAAMKGVDHLFHLFVSNTHQRQGLGRMLWELVKTSTLEKNVVKKFTVNSSGNARGFYAKLGFTSTGEAVTAGGITHHPMELQMEAGGR